MKYSANNAGFEMVLSDSRLTMLWKNGYGEVVVSQKPIVEEHLADEDRQMAAAPKEMFELARRQTIPDPQ